MNQNEMREAFEKPRSVGELIRYKSSGEYHAYKTQQAWVGFEEGYQEATAAAEAKYLPVIEKLERERNDAVSFLQGIARQIQFAYPHRSLAQPLLGGK